MLKFTKYLPALFISCGMLALPSLGQTIQKAPSRHPRPGDHVTSPDFAPKESNANKAPAAAEEEEDKSAFEATTHFLITRINQMEIDTKIRQMKNNNQTEYKGVVGFTAEGALFYNREILQHHEDQTGDEVVKLDHQAERTQGAQILPFKIGILSDGSARVSVGLASFRNHDPRHPYLGVLRRQHSFKNIKNVPKFVLAADFLVFEWDNHNTEQHLSTRQLKIGAVTFRKPIAQDRTRANVLALTAGGSIGYAQANARIEDGRGILIGSEKNPIDGFAIKTGAQVGLKFNHFSEAGRDTRLEIGVDLKNTRLSGYGMDEKAPPFLRKVRQYTIDRTQYDADITQFLIDHHLPDPGVNIDAAYNRFTGKPPPIYPMVPGQNIVLSSTVLSPSASYKFALGKVVQKSKLKNGESASNQTMLGISAGANIPLNYTIKGGSPEESSIHESFADQLDVVHASVGIYF
ncbi:MAG: hypothetical protein H7333_05890 [Bdellovibrionales bacterium]|nr:hypothetical protein [Oligoflexia bacterium]